MTTNNLEHLTQRLLDWYETQSWAAKLKALTPRVLSELARGEPVDVARKRSSASRRTLSRPASPPASRSVSNWLLRRDDQVGCIVFAPVDLAESRRRRYERER
jgi:hypothetical protein